MAFDGQLAVRVRDATGRPMKSTLFVAGEGVREDADLSDWVGRAVDFCLSQPPKVG